MAECPACGTANSDGSRFCISCGKEMPSEEHLSSTCSTCGAENSLGSRFCAMCGNPLYRPPGAEPPPSSTIPESSTAHGACLAILERKLVGAGFDSVSLPPMPGLARSFRRKQFEPAMVGHVTAFCGIHSSDVPVTASLVKSFSTSLFDYAVKNKGYLARNALQPLVVYPVLIASKCLPDVQPFLNSFWPKHWMAYEFPVVIDVTEGNILFHRSRPLWGLLNFESIRTEAERLFALD